MWSLYCEDMLYDTVAELPVEIDGYDFRRQKRDTSSGFTRATTVVSLQGNGKTGNGEDVTDDTHAHDALQQTSEEFPLAGTFTIDEFSKQVSELDLFLGTEPGQKVFRHYRQWAFESAALDLALKQADATLAERVDRDYRPVRFVVSTRLSEPPTGDPSSIGSTAIRRWSSNSTRQPTGPRTSFLRSPTPAPSPSSTSKDSTTGRPSISQRIPTCTGG